mmetsp:Transcript_8187/g.25277  ORF Transcript_8187/g.25277 Transcript_8187/m.25277 type:complete len:210 (-) Transcript_8187:492-1121(-)
MTTNKKQSVYEKVVAALHSRRLVVGSSSGRRLSSRPTREAAQEQQKQLRGVAVEGRRRLAAPGLGHSAFLPRMLRTRWIRRRRGGRRWRTRGRGRAGGSWTCAGWAGAGGWGRPRAGRGSTTPAERPPCGRRSCRRGSRCWRWWSWRRRRRTWRRGVRGGRRRRGRRPGEGRACGRSRPLTRRRSSGWCGRRRWARSWLLNEGRRRTVT